MSHFSQKTVPVRKLADVLDRPTLCFSPLLVIQTFKTEEKTQLLLEAARTLTVR